MKPSTWLAVVLSFLFVFECFDPQGPGGLCFGAAFLAVAAWAFVAYTAHARTHPDQTKLFFSGAIFGSMLTIIAVLIILVVYVGHYGSLTVTRIR